MPWYSQGGITPLHLATEGAHANIVGEIIGKVSNVNQCTSPTVSVLEFTVYLFIGYD